MSKIKTIAAVIVILGILGLLLTSSSFKIPAVGDIAKYISIPSLNSVLNSFTPAPSGNPFPFTLAVYGDPLDGQNLAAQNSNINLIGANFANLQIGNLVYRPNSGADVQIYGFNGNIQFTYGTVVLNGNAASVSIDSTGVSPSSGQFNLAAQFTAGNYTISSLSANSLVLRGIYGNLTKFGTSSASQQLVNDTLQLGGFQGSAQLSGNYLITGAAVSIKGNTFSWTG